MNGKECPKNFLDFVAGSSKFIFHNNIQGDIKVNLQYNLKDLSTTKSYYPNSKEIAINATIKQWQDTNAPVCEFVLTVKFDGNYKNIKYLGNELAFDVLDELKKGISLIVNDRIVFMESINKKHVIMDYNRNEFLESCFNNFFDRIKKLEIVVIQIDAINIDNNDKLFCIYGVYDIKMKTWIAIDVFKILIINKIYF